MKSDLVILGKALRKPINPAPIFDGQARPFAAKIHFSDHRPAAGRNVQSRPSELAPAVLDVEVTELVRQLIRKADATRDLRDATDRTVLDVTIEGFRCLVLRRPDPGPAHRSVPLSPREREIVLLAAMGHPNKIIAHQLNISIWTVSTHLRHVFAKLNVTSRTAMVAKVLEAERMSPEQERASSGGICHAG